MKAVMTEDIVNEICKVCSEALGKPDTFSIFEGEIRKINEAMSGFYPYEESILVGTLDSSLSVESEIFLSDMNFFKDDMALVFFVRDDIIEMYFCHDSWDGFQSELTFTFKKTFDDDLFD
jgi:hypothetical protein